MEWIITHLYHVAELLLGILVLLMAGGVVPVSKNPQANAVFRKKYWILLLLAAASLCIHGGLGVAGIKW